MGQSSFFLLTIASAAANTSCDESWAAAAAETREEENDRRPVRKFSVMRGTWRVNRGGGRGLRRPSFVLPSRRHATYGARVRVHVLRTRAAAAEAEIPATKARELPILELRKALLTTPCRAAKRRAAEATAVLADWTTMAGFFYDDDTCSNVNVSIWAGDGRQTDESGQEGDIATCTGTRRSTRYLLEYLEVRYSTCRELASCIISSLEIPM